MTYKRNPPPLTADQCRAAIEAERMPQPSQIVATLAAIMDRLEPQPNVAPKPTGNEPKVGDPVIIRLDPLNGRSAKIVSIVRAYRKGVEEPLYRVKTIEGSIGFACWRDEFDVVPAPGPSRWRVSTWLEPDGVAVMRRHDNKTIKITGARRDVIEEFLRVLDRLEP